jgi:hypothetical protein
MSEQLNNKFHITGPDNSKIPVEKFSVDEKNLFPNELPDQKQEKIELILAKMAENIKKQGYNVNELKNVSINKSTTDWTLQAEIRGESVTFPFSFGNLEGNEAPQKPTKGSLKKRNISHTTKAKPSILRKIINLFKAASLKFFGIRKSSPTNQRPASSAPSKSAARVSSGQAREISKSYPPKTKPSTLKKIANLFQAIKYKLFGNEEAEETNPLSNERPTLSAQSEAEASAQGQQITQEYFDGKQKVGAEIIERCDVLNNYKGILEQEGSNDLNQLEKYIKTRKKNGKQTEWVKSSDFRQHCKESTYEEACKTFPLGAPVNMRLHKMESHDGTEQILRMGVITDVSNGWYSLKDLQEMKTKPELIQKKKDEIDEFIAHPSKLGILGKIIQKFKPDYGSLKGDRLASAERAKKLLENVDTTLENRKKVLQRQMLQVVTEQLNANPDKIKEGEPFNLFQVSLLNLKKKHLDSTGWMHDEEVAYEDMRRIMHEFQDMKVMLGGKEAPKIDTDQKTIFIPSEKNAEITLNTFVFNISPQGNLKNDDVQLYDNSVELDRLKAKHPDFFDKHDHLRNRLVGDDSGYDLAEDLSACIADHLKNDTHGSLGINCMSGKDRTGFVAARLMIRNLPSSEKFAKKILNKDYPATKVVEDNTPGVRVLKIHPVTNLEKGLPGFTNHESIGYIFRQFMEMGTQKLPT